MQRHRGPSYRSAAALSTAPGRFLSPSNPEAAVSPAATPEEKPFRRPPSPRFRLFAELDNRGVRVPCTVVLVRPVSAGGEVVFRLRRLHSRRTYDVLLSEVARRVYRREVAAEVEAKRKARRARR